MTLNEKQREAVENGDGKCLVISGAGSGKTAVITARIKHLIDSGISPESILAFTFTNKAANEMKGRIKKQVGDKADRIWIGTFHAICAKILRLHGPIIGLNSNFTIADEADSMEVLRVVMKERMQTVTEESVRTSLSIFGYWTNSCVTPPEDSPYKELFEEYLNKLRKSNIIDFNGLISYTIEILKKALVVQFSHVLVDEFQDTNIQQMVLINLLVKEKGNLFVVGDDAQAIYSWRFATIENILRFNQDPTVKKFVLEQNYRCAPLILDAANSVIQCNQRQIEKRLWTENRCNNKIGLLYAYDNYTEAESISRYIRKSKSDDIAILCRTNSQMRDIQTSLVRGSIPHKVMNGQSLFGYKVVKDFLSYLRLVDNPRDIFAFRRIVNFPKRGIGDKTLSKITEYIAENDLDVITALTKHLDKMGLSKKIQTELSDFIKIIQACLKVNDDVYDVAEIVMDNVDFLNGDDEMNDVFDDFLELINYNRRRLEVLSLRDFITMCSLYDDNSEPQSNPTVKLLTIHSAKGLEFDTVIIPGLEENILPHIGSVGNPDAVEEERRLFYVALTRAKTNAIISICFQRNIYGSVVVDCRPSRFIREIPRDLLDQIYI